MDQAKKPQTRRGAVMSLKQIGRAAAEERKIAFHTGTLDISGYVVGSDDFHWMVAATHPEYGVYTALVHKSCPVVVFTSSTVRDESEESQETIRGIGAPFWKYCRETFMGPLKKEQ